MSDILDQLALIKNLLQEQAEDCALQAKYEQERREAVDKQRAETDVLEAEVREKLQKIVDRGKDSNIHVRGRTGESEDLDVILQLVRENHDSSMEMIQRFFNDCSTIQQQQRTQLLKEIFRMRRKS
ncbi:hypothetical protein K438DRAFT_1852166 [Mycena galopus ATCC 62051]|nr:hypothetical protein K438DRAFT_1852166 [Mycena galopus ATCC 62051]